MDRLKKVFPKKVRAYIYSVALAFLPLAAFLGWVDPEALPLIVPLILAILNLSDDEVKNGA